MRKQFYPKLFLACMVLCNCVPSSVWANTNNTTNTHLTAQQELTITGVVSDSEGNPIAGATVTLQNTTVGDITGANGGFSVKANEGDILVAEFIGYKSATATVGKSDVVNFVLEIDALVTDEVVVIGYGTQKKVSVTGAVSMVGDEVLESRPVQNVSQALQGVIPGLNLSVGNTGGALDSELAINIRGAGTIGDGSNSSPLVLIDGVEGNMNTVNPNDIESVSVLKDAAASAIYGSRAAFGVILITTKSGKEGKTQVTYSFDTRYSQAIGTPDMMDSEMFANYFNRASLNEGGAAVFSDEVMDRIVKYKNGEIDYGTVANPAGTHWQYYTGANANTDWFDYWYKDWAPTTSHNLSISGGNEKTTYRISGSMLNQTGLIDHTSDDFQRNTLNARVDTELYSWLRMTYNGKWTRENYERPTYMTGLFFHNIARRWPTNPIVDPNGYATDASEIPQMVDGGRQNSEKDFFTNQIKFTATPLEGWNIVADASYKTNLKNEHYDLLPINVHNPDGEELPISWDGSLPAGGSRIYEIAEKTNYWTTNIYSNYNFKLNEHNFTVMGGFNAELNEMRDLSGRKDGLYTPNVPTINTATSNPNIWGGYEHWSSAGFFGRLNYDYQEKYLLEVNFRYDGASRFIGDKRWGSYPSVSAGWNIAKEDFFAPIADKVSMLKLRASWGQLGNMNTKALYPFYQTLPVGSVNSSWLIDGEKQNTASAPGIVTSLLTWETVQSWNIGLDWAAFNNRLTGSFDYFERATLDMIGPAPELPNILGTAVPKVNNTDQITRGWEIQASWRDRIGDDFSYGINVVLSDAQTEITQYPNDSGLLSTYYNGQMTGDIWGYTSVGIAKTDAEMEEHLLENKPTWGSQWAAGDMMYADLNGDGEVSNGQNTLTDHGDLSVIGNSTARYNFGITLDAAYKGIDIKAFFQGVGKRDVWLTGPYMWGATGGMWQSAGFVEHWDFFRPEGDPLGANLDAYYTRPLFTQSEKNQYKQTHYLQNGAYIRLKNLQVGYTFPTKLLEKINVSYLRVYVSADNLWTGTSLTDIFDPETIGGEWGAGKLYPLQRTIAVGLNVNF